MPKRKDEKPEEQPDEKPDATPDDTDEEPNEEPKPDADEEPDTFTREYVEGLRADVAKYRTKAKRTEEYAHRLHTELVRKTGRLADPADLEFDEEHLADPDKLTASIDSLLDQRPHLKSRKVTGDVNQGNRGDNGGPTDFLGLMRQQL